MKKVVSYPGFLLVFFIFFLFTIGIWMFINPMLANPNHQISFNYGGIFFLLIAFALLFTLKIYTFENEEIEIKIIITGKKEKISFSEISEITVREDIKYPKLEIQFKRNDLADISLKYRTSFHEIITFFRENYPDLVNEQELID